MCIGLGVLWWGLIEACCLKVARDRLIINADSSDVTDPDTPDLRIFYFCDLHKECCPIPVRRILKIIRAENENGGLDAVVFGGDISNGKKTAVKGFDYLNAIGEECRRLHIPYMAVTGNHDATVPPDELGCFVFDNMDGCIKYLKSRRDGRYIAVAGVPDSGRKERVWAVPPTPQAGIDYKAYVLLSHNPDLVLHLPPDLPFKIDCMISGHIHGGQIRTPFGLEFDIRHDELPHMNVIAGLHELNGIKVFISKGLGCVMLPLRIGARPEVNVIELYA
ncbi:MAG: metallophosphoesterase [Clostridiales bacterium]|nr:metallophosphoesterase [Clostridiales bacterium]